MNKIWKKEKKQNTYIPPRNYIKIDIDRKYIGMTQEERNKIKERNKKEK